MKKHPAMRSISIAAALTCLSMAHAQTIAPPTEETLPAEMLPEVTVSAERTKDEVGHDNVYEKDISNAYVDRQTLDRFKGKRTGDVFSGMNGVYNNDNQNGSALSPSIRGISGNGRIPVTVDGTQQSLDVWQAMRGINNRSYVDSNLFRSIEVEKGPSMTRGLKSGIGGSVNVRTIDASDIVEPGKSWGLEIKAGVGNNSIKPSFDAHSIAGMDYRDIPGATTTTLVGVPGITFHEPLAERRGGSSAANKFDGSNRKIFVAGAYQHEAFDLLAAYSEAKQGNFFAGKNGVGDYVDNMVKGGYWGIADSVKNTYPNIGKIFAPHYEVPYTSTSAKSFLLKGNIKLADKEKINLSMQRNRLEFGELPSVLTSGYLFHTDREDTFNVATKRVEYPFPLTTVDQKVYRLGYELKPEGSRWLDLQANIWRTDNQSSRYQNGDTTYQVTEADRLYDRYYSCINDPAAYGDTCGTDPGRQENIDGRYNTFIGNRIDSHGVRNGIDLSNRFQLAKGLNLTLAADWMREKVRDFTPVETSVLGIGSAASRYGPASGTRTEYGTSANVEWQATSRLQLSGGVRYGAWKGYDDETAMRRSQKNTDWANTTNLTAMKLEAVRLATDEELQKIQSIWDGMMSGQITTVDEYNQAVSELGTWLEDRGINLEANPNYAFVNSLVSMENNLRGWDMAIEVPLKNGIADSSQNPFLNGSLDITETVSNQQGQQGEQNLYTVLANTNMYYTGTPSSDPWQSPEEKRSHAWSSQFVASYLLNERSRVYARYGEMARFPSIMESSNNAGRGSSGTFSIELQPERSQAWELGYTYDMSHLLPSLNKADVKLAYYQNNIKNYYDRTLNLITVQYEQKKMRGLELQSRFDTGRFYGGLGANYILKQQMCDKDFAAQLDPVYGRIPNCMDGGFPGTLAYSSLQPKYSLTLDFGTRLMQQKLNLGARLRYYSKAENKTLNNLLKKQANWQEQGYQYAIQNLTGINRPYSTSAVGLVDVFVEYQLSRNSTTRITINNLTDRYYIDPLSRVMSPGAGRTVMLDMTIRF